MDDIQDWLADARYSASLIQGSHLPLQRMPRPDQNWYTQTCPGFVESLDLSLAGILQNPLGEYWFKRYLEEVHPQQQWRAVLLDLATRSIKGECNPREGCQDILNMPEFRSHMPELHAHFEASFSSLEEPRPLSHGSMFSSYSTVDDESSAGDELKAGALAAGSAGGGEGQAEEEDAHGSADTSTPGTVNGAHEETVAPGSAAEAAASSSSNGEAKLPSPTRLAYERSEESMYESGLRIVFDSVIESLSENIDLGDGTHVNIFKEFLNSGFSPTQSAPFVAASASAPASSSSPSSPTTATATTTSSGASGGSTAPAEENFTPIRCPATGNVTGPNHMQRYVETLWWAQQPCKRSDFAIFRDIGRGAFGVVSSVTCVYTGEMFALKAMDKHLIKGKRANHLVMAEYNALQVLTQSPSPFTVSLRYSFTDEEHIYFCLNLLTGGDLRFHISMEQRFDLATVQFWAAQLCCGLHHLKKHGIIYRDLKPENIMLDSDGNAVITDYGLAVIVKPEKPMLRGRAGTSGYWAPEVLNKEKYGFAADWWSLGCVIFELVRGMGPFSRRNTKLPSRDVATNEFKVKFTAPEFQQYPDLPSLLRLLLRRQPRKRLSSLKHCKHHRFFHGIDWEALQHGRISPPFRPASNGAINCESARDIGRASSQRDLSFRNLKLEADDKFPEASSIAVLPHQKDVVKVLEMDQRGELKHLYTKSNGCCCTIT